MSGRQGSVVTKTKSPSELIVDSEDHSLREEVIMPDSHEILRERPILPINPLNHHNRNRLSSSSVDYIDDPVHPPSPSSSPSQAISLFPSTAALDPALIHASSTPTLLPEKPFALEHPLTHDDYTSTASIVTPTPVTFYTTFTYFTTELLSGQPVVYSREQVISSIVRGKVLPTRVASTLRPSIVSLHSFSLLNHPEDISSNTRVKRSPEGEKDPLHPHLDSQVKKPVAPASFQEGKK